MVRTKICRNTKYTTEGLIFLLNVFRLVKHQCVQMHMEKTYSKNLRWENWLLRTRKLHD